MFLDYVYRWRCAIALFLFVTLGMAEYAESGLFRRCRSRWRCCRRVVCEPVCCESTATTRAAMEKSCAGQFCPHEIVAEVVDINGNCVERTYRGEKCGDGMRHYTDACALNPPTNCQDCIGCVVLPPTPIPIPIPPPPRSAAAKRVESYVAEVLCERGVRKGVKLKSGPKYVCDDVHILELQLLDEEQRPIDGEKRLVELDWFKYRQEGQQPSVGLGIEIQEGKAQELDVTYERVCGRVYSLLLRLEGEKEARHYVILLQGDVPAGK